MSGQLNYEALNDYMTAEVSLPYFSGVDVFTDVNVTKSSCFLIGTALNWDDLKVLIKNNIAGKTTSGGQPAMLSLAFHFDNSVGTIDFKQEEDSFEKILSVFISDTNSKLITDFVNEVFS